MSIKIDRVYTRTGDTGQTSLANGQRVLKNNPFIVACGEFDELSVAVGYARTLCNKYQLNKEVTLLKRIQNHLFDLGYQISQPHPKAAKKHFSKSKTQSLEKHLDHYQKNIPTLKSFVLPGGDLTNIAFHQCRIICRKLERTLISIHQEQKIHKNILSYINRLSDLFFVMSRYSSIANQSTEYLWENGI